MLFGLVTLLMYITNWLIFPIFIYRHGHKFERNLLKSGKRELFPTHAHIRHILDNVLHTTRQKKAWKKDWKIFYAGFVIFENNQKIIDLNDIFQEKSLYMSDYQVEATLSIYIKPQREENLVLVLQLLDNHKDCNKGLTYFEPFQDPMGYKEFSSNKKWIKLVFSKTISLKNVRYLRFSWSLTYGSVNEVSVGTCLPRATLKFSFPMQREQVIT